MIPLPPPPRRRRGRTITLLAMAALVVVAVVAVAIVRLLPGEAPGHPPRQQDGRPTKVGRYPDRVPPQAAGTSPAAVPPVSTSGWRSVTLDGTTVPVSATDGPAHSSGPLASGWTDTPAGAVLAAINIAARASGQLGPDIYRPTITGQVTGSSTAALLTAAGDDYAAASAQNPPVTSGGPAGVADAFPVAFKLTTWAASSAAVTVLTAADGEDAPEAVVRLQVRWLNGDWKLAAPAGGNFAEAATAASTMSGFSSLPGR